MAQSLLDDETLKFHVVVDREERHSIWPADRTLPSGWRLAGFSGNKAECLAHIDTAWHDMRPLSLRRRNGEPARDRH